MSALDFGDVAVDPADPEKVYAAFQAAVLNYQNVVLEAQREVEDGLSALAAARERGRFGALDEAGTPQSPPTDAEQDDARQAQEADAFGDEVGRIVSSLSDTLRFPILLCYMD